MTKQTKIDKAIYEVDEKNKTYRFLKRNLDWKNLSSQKNAQNKLLIKGYKRIIDKKKIVNVDKKELLETLLKKSLRELLDNLSSPDPNIKFTSSKALIKLSEEYPQKLYPNFEDFIKLFDHDNNFIKWTGIIIIGNLVQVDKNEKINKIMSKLFSLLNTGKMITANNTIEALGKIACVKPELQDKITKELLKVKNYQYDTKECNNITVGKVMDSLNIYLKQPDQKIINFVRQESANSRNATAQKAQKLLKKYN